MKDYAIISLDPGGMVTTWNAGAQRLKGYAAEEIIGRHLSVLYPPEALADGRLDDELLEAEASGHVEAQGWRVRKDSSRFWAEVVTTALRDSGGKLLGFAKIDKDITARRETEEQIQKLNLELNQRVFELGTANKELESFTSVFTSQEEFEGTGVGTGHCAADHSTPWRRNLGRIPSSGAEPTFFFTLEKPQSRKIVPSIYTWR